MRAEMNMFSAQIKTIGNPTYRPGSIVRLKDRRMDYYCTDVVHNWSIQEGYTCTLLLVFGHTSGVLPVALTGGILTDNTANNEQCQIRSQALSTYISPKIYIGGVNAHCLISAMWSFMTCGAPTDQAMTQATPEYENSAPRTTTYADWITPYGWDSTTKERRGYSTLSQSYSPIPANYVAPLVSTYIPIINNYIKQYGLDAYNVTANLVMNILNQESSFYADALNGMDGGLGWFQLTCSQQFPANPTQLFSSSGQQVFQQDFNITVQDAVYNFDKACNAAMSLLADKFKNSKYTKKGNTGDAFLLGLGAYNGDVSSNHGPSYAYQRLVLGSSQVNAIANGTQIPNGAKAYNINSGLSCQPQGPGLPQWRYPVYGPIGERLDAYMERNPGLSKKAAKQQLTTFSTGMAEAVSYITGLMRKYENQGLPGAGINGTSGAFVNGNDLMQKVIAAWYSNDNMSSLTNDDTQILQASISGIEKSYTECLSCSGISNIAQVGQDLSQNISFNNINFRYPCANPVITAQFGPPARSKHNHFHPGLDLVDSSGSLDVLATADGYVIEQSVANAGNVNGESVVILHGDASQGICTRYLDIKGNPGLLHTKVTQGQVIGQQVPCSGESGLHIHCEIRHGCVINGSGTNLSFGYNQGGTSQIVDAGNGYISAAGYASGIAVDGETVLKK